MSMLKRGMEPPRGRPQAPNGTFVVARVRRATYSLSTPAAPPPEIREHFEGRSFTLLELERRGVRIAGGQAVFTANGLDWWLDLAPALRPESVAEPENA